MSGAPGSPGTVVGAPDRGRAEAAVSLTPTLRASARRRRIWFGFAALLVLGAIVLFVVQGAVSAGGPRLGADNPAPTGAKALVQVLGDHGVTVTDARAFDAALDGATAGATVVAVRRVRPARRRSARRCSPTPRERLVVIEPGFGALESLAPGVRAGGAATGPLDDVACDVRPSPSGPSSLSDGQRLLTVDDEAARRRLAGLLPRRRVRVRDRVPVQRDRRRHRPHPRRGGDAVRERPHRRSTATPPSPSGSPAPPTSSSGTSPVRPTPTPRRRRPWPT